MKRSMYSVACLMILLLVSCDRPKTLSDDWTHLSSEEGDIESPGPSTQQTACLILDVDGDGLNDFVIGSRKEGPSVLWYRRVKSGWKKYVVDNSSLPIEAGGAHYDIDSDGDLDIVFGGDSQSNKIWWWENPNPHFSKGKSWKRHLIKHSGANMHHDEIFGDFDGDGETELVFWNQGARKAKANTLYMAEIPLNPRNAEAWLYRNIFTSSYRCEGLASIDIDQDGQTDIVGGGSWFERLSKNSYRRHPIDEKQKGARVAVGQLKEGGRPEVVFVMGDGKGPLKWYEYDGTNWVGSDLLGFPVDHGHSLDVGDYNADGKLDILCGEMRLDQRNRNAKLWIFYGNGQGQFKKTVVAKGYGVHEAKKGDLDGDGDIDILGKPYNWRTPRIDVWMNNRIEDSRLSIDAWQRHVIDSAKPWRSVFISSADMDNDGRKDIITGGWWYKNPGAVSDPWQRQSIGLGLNNAALVYDFDADGDQDVLGTQGKGADPNATFVWAANDGQGTFVPHTNISQGEGDFLQGVAADHFIDRDLLQIMLSWHASGKGIQRLTVPEHPSKQKWPWQNVAPLSQDECLSSGDIDQDGDPDLLLGTIWMRNDSTTWTPMVIKDGEGAPDRNRLADINGDGMLDAVVGFESISKEGALVWYEQQERGWDEHLVDRIIGPMSLDVADMDNDGDMDIISGEHNLRHPSKARLFIFENKDGIGGRWKRHMIHQGDEHHDGARAVDIDGDGDTDIISIGWSHPKVVLYENRAVVKN